MGDFELIETGFSSADETINFGTRSFASENLFEISTLTCFKSGDDSFMGVSDVIINSIVKNGFFYFSTGKMLKVFKREDFSALIFNASFGSDILCIAVSPCENLIILGLQTGTIKILKIDKNDEVTSIFSECLKEGFIPQNICIDTNSEVRGINIKCIVVSQDGTIFRISVSEIDQESQFDIKTEEIVSLGEKVHVSFFKYPLVLTNGSRCSITNIETGDVISDLPLQIKRIFTLGRMFLYLDYKGKLAALCYITGRHNFKIDYDVLLDDFLVLEDKSILAVTKPDELGEIYLKLLKPDFQSMFSLKIKYPVHLVQSDSNADILFVSLVRNDSGNITELRLQMVCETDPISRFNRLIQRQRFQEAEKFAAAFNIDPTTVLKATAQFIVDKTECSSEDINKLCALMDSIDDSYFNLLCCANVEYSSFEDAKKVLLYGSKITPKASELRKEDILVMKKTMMDLLFRFQTFTALSENNDDIHAWQKFSRCNLLEAVNYCLEQKRIEDAILIYNRLDQESIKSLNEQYILSLLEIFKELPQDMYLSFLPTFVPITMSHMPAAMPLFVNWLHNRILYMEKRDKSNFPEAIDIVESILKLIRIDKFNGKSLQVQCMLNRKGIEDLANLLKGLQTLEKLKQEYGISVDLSEYLKGPKSFMSTILRIYMPPEVYDTFLKNFLYVYMLQNNVDPNVVFAEEINILLQYGESWLPTIEIILGNISSLEEKLQLTFEILLNSPVPWCDITRRIVQKALQYSHPIVDKIAAAFNSEARIKVIKNRKYLINKKKLNELVPNEAEFERVVKRIIYINEDQMVEDIFHLCLSDREYVQATVILADHFILKGQLELAKFILNRNKQEIVYLSAIELFNLVEYNMKQKFQRATAKEKYYEALPEIFKILSNKTDKSKEKEIYEKRFRLLRGAYFFNQKLGTSLIAGDFMSPISKKTKYEELIENVISTLDESSFEEILEYSERQAYYLNKDKDEVLLTLCNKLGNFKVLISAGEYLYENDSSAKNLCLMAILYLKYLGVQDSFPLNTTAFETVVDQTLQNFTILGCDDDSTANDIFLQGLKLARKLIVKAMVKEASNLQITEVHNWINSCYDLTRPKSTLCDELYNTVYRPKQNVPSTILLQTVQACFQGFVNSIDPKTDFYSEYFTFFSPSGGDLQIVKQPIDIVSLSSAMDSFCREGQQRTAYFLLKTLTNSLILHSPQDTKIIMTLTALLFKIPLPNLIRDVAAADQIDVEFLYSLLIVSGQDYLKWIYYFLPAYKRRASKLNDLSRIGIRLLDFHNETSENKVRDVMVNSVKLCKWWKKLRLVNSKVNYEDFFKSKPDPRLRQLINLDLINLDDVKLYCIDFNLEVDEYYKEFLKSTLTNYKPLYEVKRNIDDKKILVLKSDGNMLYNKCNAIVATIEDKQGVQTTLEKAIREVNPYYYEIFLTTYKLLENHFHTSYLKNCYLLCFLMEYTRSYSPGQREKEEWYLKFPDAQFLDPLSEFRFPFTSLFFTADIWNILRPEVDLNSYKLWFKPTSILNKTLKVDDICAYAVKQVVSSGILGDCSSKDWTLYSKFEDLFAKIDECIAHMKNLERATSVAYHVMNNTPNGADKVKAAQLSLKYAVLYKEQNGNNPEVEKAFIKIKNKFYSISVWNILHRFNLAKEKYLELVTHPEVLIENLYMDEKISKQAMTLSLEYSDINYAVEALSELFEYNIQEIRHDLLNRWLGCNTKIDMNSTIFSSFNTPSFLPLNNDDHLKRAIYICTSGSREYWEKYLIKVGMEEEGPNVQDRGLAFRANALKCFCAITDDKRIVELFNLSYNEFLNYVDKLTLLSELESLGISLNTETLDQFSKRELLKKLSRMGKPVAIKCMGALCIIYFLEDDKYWEYIINSSIKLDMVSELKNYVDFLKNKYDKSFYIKAWQVIIDKTFEQITQVSAEDLNETLTNNFLMVQSCPVVFSLNFERIIEICINLNKREYAALLLQYTSEETRKKITKMFENETVPSKLNELENKGLWGINNLQKNVCLN